MNYFNKTLISTFTILIFCFNFTLISLASEVYTLEEMFPDLDEQQHLLEEMYKIDKEHEKSLKRHREKFKKQDEEFQKSLKQLNDNLDDLKKFRENNNTQINTVPYSIIHQNPYSEIYMSKMRIENSVKNNTKDTLQEPLVQKNNDISQNSLKCCCFKITAPILIALAVGAVTTYLFLK